MTTAILTRPAPTRYEHVSLDDQRVPWIAGTTMKVIELVLDYQTYGWSPEELRFQHPYLTLGQIHSALAYYWDHQEQLDDDIQRRLRKVERLRRQARVSSLQARLRSEQIQ